MNTEDRDVLYGLAIGAPEPSAEVIRINARIISHVPVGDELAACLRNLWRAGWNAGKKGEE